MSSSWRCGTKLHFHSTVVLCCLGICFADLCGWDFDCCTLPSRSESRSQACMTEGGPFTQTVFVHVKNEEQMLMAKHTSKKKEKDTSRPKPSIGAIIDIQCCVLPQAMPIPNSEHGYCSFLAVQSASNTPSACNIPPSHSLNRTRGRQGHAIMCEFPLSSLTGGQPKFWLCTMHHNLHTVLQVV